MSTRTKAAVADTLPALFPAVFPGHGDDAPLDLPPITEQVQQQIKDRVVSRDFDAWSEALARVGNCSRPIRLHGHSQTVDATTGEILSSYSSRHEPLGVTHVRCGNRRATDCPSCSRLYAADTFHLIRAGVAGGKTVPETVAENPLVFATVTAPSFGPVHGRRDSARPATPPAAGRSCVRMVGPGPAKQSHGEDDPLLGQPLCGELLRLRLAGGLAVVGAGPVAPVHHRAAHGWSPRPSTCARVPAR